MIGNDANTHRHPPAPDEDLRIDPAQREARRRSYLFPGAVRLSARLGPAHTCSNNERRLAVFAFTGGGGGRKECPKKFMMYRPIGPSGPGWTMPNIAKCMPARSRIRTASGPSRASASAG